MANIVIDEEWCKGCFLCLHYCKQEIFGKSKKRNTRGYPLPQILTPEKCTSCKSCEFICPELAVSVEKEEKK